MKLLLFADHQVGLNILNYLVDDFPEDIALVVTTEINDIYLRAKSLNIQTQVFNSKKIDIDHSDINFDLGILAWWPNIIRNPLLSRPKQGFINFHPSLLPHNRGKHYNFWALVEQAPFGVTLHRVDEGVDTGAIISQQTIPYDWTDNGETLYFKAQKEMVSLFRATYPKLRKGVIEVRPQDLSMGSFHRASELDVASKIDINAKYSARDLLNLLRARTFEGHPGCWFEDENGEKYEVKIHIKRKDDV